MEAIQIPLAQKEKTFSRNSSSFLKSRLNFEHVQKNDDPPSGCISEFTVSDKGD